MGQLALQDVKKSFGSTEVIKGVSLDVKDGEFIVFVGPSGCGKSTLLRMIAGLEEVSDGTVFIDGKVVNNLPPVKRGISMVFQSYALYPHMSVYENIAFPLRVAKMSEAEVEERVRKASRILQLDERLKHKPGQLSGGQRQRVAIGRAIVREPSVFLFDEPLSNLDAALRSDMRVELSKLHGSLGATMIYVTHDQIEAMTMADRIVVLDGGVISQVGSPLELYHKPQNLFVAGFIGNPKMNFVEVTCKASAENSVTVTLPDGGEVEVPVKGQANLEGQKMTLGIRPEHIKLGQADAHISVVANVVERLGIHTVSHATVEGANTSFCSLLDGAAPVVVGEAAPVGFNASDCHLFDSTGAALERLVKLEDVDPAMLQVEPA
ncbi:sn-glycerol-3-phosphate ABC transporter ATP-binding protein UgpC [Rhodobacteraceae bacterium RKSG542]|uniref:ABC transporter ATP-binding protein n=1 Tax=Pseudovibrio flavus TaxID=2529854 RepID=UPI0012BD6F07|nr:sn-glycerol-3-phosphate ABC transporter ATP-binding protein UgpC [Pseudovibrio flavus]MTI18081.1 sn-glycerol-3-phosphate ABC transporter ATP-binding protein UgpC [Pseudovibrio flavus]